MIFWRCLAFVGTIIPTNESRALYRKRERQKPADCRREMTHLGPVDQCLRFSSLFCESLRVFVVLLLFGSRVMLFELQTAT